MNITKEYIDPNKASVLLLDNKVNRPQNKQVIDLYARDMRNGDWRFTHQGILLGKDGCLIDGQHRLIAIVKTGFGQWMYVTRDESLTSPLDLPIDVGNKRGTAFINGVSKTLSAVAAFAFKLETNISYHGAADIKKYIDIFHDPLEVLLGYGNTAKKGITNAAVQTACCTLILKKHNVDYVCSMYNKVTTDKFTEFSPIVASFYKQIVIDQIRFDGRHLFSRAIRAFDYSKKNLSRLQIKDEQFAYEEAKKIFIEAIHKKH